MCLVFTCFVLRVDCQFLALWRRKVWHWLCKMAIYISIVNCLGKHSKSSWGWLKFLCNPTDLHRAYFVLLLGMGPWGITTYNYSLWLPFFGGRGGDLLREANSFGIIWWCCPDVSFDCSPLGVTDLCHFLPYMGKMFTHFWHTMCSRFFSVGGWNQQLDGLLTTIFAFCPVLGSVIDLETPLTPTMAGH